MLKPSRSSLLCPNCRKLISRDEPRCPHCGLARPGSRLKDNVWTRGLKDPLTLIQGIIVVNAVMFVLSLLLAPGALRMSLGDPFRFLSPAVESLFLLGASGTEPVLVHGRWWTLISAAYLHGGLLHILFNMFALRHLGPFVIREFGPYRTFIIYTLASVIGYGVSFLAGIRFTIGASAAVCGLIGAILFYSRHRGGTYGQAVYSQVVGWLIGLFLIGLAPGINNWAHGGGIIGGIILAAILGYSERRPEGFGHKALAGICALGTLAALVWAVGTTLLIVKMH